VTNDDRIKDQLGKALDALGVGDLNRAVMLLINAVARLAHETRGTVPPL
jgi:hypothetical protein